MNAAYVQLASKQLTADLLLTSLICCRCWGSQSRVSYQLPKIAIHAYLKTANGKEGETPGVVLVRA